MGSGGYCSGSSPSSTSRRRTARASRAPLSQGESFANSGPVSPKNSKAAEKKASDEAAPSSLTPWL